MQFLWLSLYQWTYVSFLKLIKNPQDKTIVFTPNPEILLRTSRDPEFLEILKQANYLTPDANGLYVWAQMLEGKSFLLAGFRTFFSKKSLREKYGELIQGSNLTKDLVEYSIQKKKKVIMIDTPRVTSADSSFGKKKMDIQSKFQELFHQKFPGLEIIPFFDTENSPEEIAQIIQKEQISYVFSCIGMKIQEQRLLEIFEYIPDGFPVVWLWVGSSFDYLLGLQKRAPLVFQKLWLEWLYRLALEPRKRWRRIWDAIYEFPKMVRERMDV